MDFIIVFDLTVFIILAICLLCFCLSVLSEIEVFVSQHIDTLLTISIIIAVVLALVSIILIAHRKKSAGLFSGLLSLMAASQLIAYLYFGMIAIANLDGWFLRLTAYIFFIVYGIINLGVYLYSHFWLIFEVGKGRKKEDVRIGYLAPFLVFAVGWLINLFLLSFFG